MNMTDTPLLSLSTSALEMPDINRDDLGKMWHLFTKCKHQIEHGRRLENMCWRLWHRSVTSPADLPPRSPPNLQQFIFTLSAAPDGWHEPLSPTPMIPSHSDCSRTTTPHLEEEEEEYESSSEESDWDDDDYDDNDDDDLIIPIHRPDHCFTKTLPRPVVRLSLLSAALCYEKKENNKMPFTLKHSTVASAVLTPIHPQSTYFQHSALSHSVWRNRFWEHCQSHLPSPHPSTRPTFGWLEHLHAW
ncbi:hypothetical protein BDF14DRAFT_605960 [Spinellus fusiger]|nr:hypothetical protein BDF14DRAFT_605960 [Spinellus fusiger]